MNPIVAPRLGNCDWLLLQLQQTPSDRVLRLALADAVLESAYYGDDSGGRAALIACNRQPTAFDGEWWWSAVGRSGAYSSGDEREELPDDWAAMMLVQPTKSFSSRDLALAAAVAGFDRLPLRRRQQLIAGVLVAERD